MDLDDRIYRYTGYKSNCSVNGCVDILGESELQVAKKSTQYVLNRWTKNIKRNLLPHITTKLQVKPGSIHSWTKGLRWSVYFSPPSFLSLLDSSSLCLGTCSPNCHISHKVRK